MIHKIVQPEGWTAPKGYANGVLASGKTLFVGGQIGWNEKQGFEAPDFVGQMEQALRNILAVVFAAGGQAEHICRLTWYVTEKQDYLNHRRSLSSGFRQAFPVHDNGRGTRFG